MLITATKRKTKRRVRLKYVWRAGDGGGGGPGGEVVNRFLTLQEFSEPLLL